mmetsp:Transcript_26701/g.49899  ORF Transcript_26701/g.49899 Transcript_26701/m.49899 type:complete len:85 (-) Transcript_26701:473-727(-)
MYVYGSLRTIQPSGSVVTAGAMLSHMVFPGTIIKALLPRAPEITLLVVVVSLDDLPFSVHDHGAISGNWLHDRLTRKKQQVCLV